MNDALKSPCLECVVHRRELDKLDPRYPCISCAERLRYALAVAGPPTRPGYWGEWYGLQSDHLCMDQLFDIGYIEPTDEG